MTLYLAVDVIFWIREWLLFDLAAETFRLRGSLSISIVGGIRFKEAGLQVHASTHDWSSW